ncbi:winged helix-turn-helix domain-containing protein [Stappia stellulata]|uniref:winged helix-turn-helix domain-containing protein n=1 Tax=Stappia stellulata TaxID=71235 RepID=UPI00048E1D6E|nr:LysR family transcriptional regulator [Stappia stellulata]
MTQDTSPARVRLRLVFSPDFALGPGKADLLEGIAETGSIAAAGRRMGMSYKRAWSLVESLNTAFAAPLVTRSRGGAKGGGASLTQTGEQVLSHYRSAERVAADAARDDVGILRDLFRTEARDGKAD